MEQMNRQTNTKNKVKNYSDKGYNSIDRLFLRYENRPYSRWLFPTYPELGRCQIQAGHSELVSLIHLLPRDLVSCRVCVQTITGHLTVNSAKYGKSLILWLIVAL